MVIKTDEEIEKIRKSSYIVSKVHELVAQNLKPGLTGVELDKMCEEFIRDHKATPSFKGYRGYPATLCISPNAVVVHGIPSRVAFKEGDVLSIDCGTFLDGYHGDCAYTYALQGVNDEAIKLMQVTKESLYIGIAKAVAGNKTGDVGNAIQSFCEKNGYGVVEELVGHGVGKNLHEPPDVPNYGKVGKGVMLKKNAVIAIEPMINLGKRHVVQDRDNWTIWTRDRKISAHFEHTVAIGIDVSTPLTDHSYCEEAIKKNEYLVFV